MTAGALLPDNWSDTALASMTRLSPIDTSHMTQLNKLIYDRSNQLGKPSSLVFADNYVVPSVDGQSPFQHFIALFVAGQGGPEILPLIEIPLGSLLEKNFPDLPVRWFQAPAGTLARVGGDTLDIEMGNTDVALEDADRPGG